MAQDSAASRDYYVLGFPLAERAWSRYDVPGLWPGDRPLPGETSGAIRSLAARVTADPGRAADRREPLPAEDLLALRTVNDVLRHLARRYATLENPGAFDRGRTFVAGRLGTEAVATLHRRFVELFPAGEILLDGLGPGDYLAGAPGGEPGLDQATRELVLLFLNLGNPAAGPAADLFDDSELRRRASFVPFVTALEEYLENREPSGAGGTGLLRLLRAPMLACPDSLSGQIRWMRENWSHLLPDDLLDLLQRTLDVLAEADAVRHLGAGPAPVLEFGGDRDRGEPEAFSRDADWMSNVVLMAKSSHVWLDQLSRWHGRPIRTLADVPDEELDRLAGWGVTGLWLIGLWERSRASARIKRAMGNPEAASSAYALHEYRIADDLGGEDAWRDLSERAGRRGIRLASDMVPNHMGIDSRWIVERPHYFLQLDHPPYPGYRFTGEDLCDVPGVAVRIEDGYWNHSDAAVVFQRVDENTGGVRYIYHGNDGTSTPWNDTAQLDYLVPEVREAVIRIILDVARRFPIIRFDAAMTLARKHYQRLWFPAPGDAGAIPSRAEQGLTREEFERAFPHEFWREVVDRVAAEAPDTLLLAEAFWLMEGYFVRTLGMHRVYNSAFMNMLKMEENAKYRQTIRNVLEFSPGILKRFVNFMNNPDERTAIEQFGAGDKYFGCALMLVTMPGLPMLGHGQVEGFSEKYGMEYRRAYWHEEVDRDMVARHEREIFPLMRRRRLFSGAENFAFFDFRTDGGWVDENVFAYTNRHGGDRALILYNNSYGSTSGRVHVSTPVNVGPADAPRLETRSLTAALALENGDGVWYRMRDHLDGLEYLRSASELETYGFHSDLRGYQARALTDFRQVRDTDGAWSEVAARLRGGGAADLDRLVRRIRREPVLARFRAWASPEVLAGLEVPGEDPVLPDDLPPAARGLAARLAALVERELPADLGPGTRRDLKDLLDGLPGSLIPQALYLAGVLDAWREAVPGAAPEDADLVAEETEDALRTWTGHDHAARSGALLAGLLAGAADAVAALSGGRTDWLADLARDPRGRELLGINRHDGRTWVNREGLRLAADAIALAALLEGEGADPLPVLDARGLVLAAGREAGYDWNRLLGVLGEG